MHKELGKIGSWNDARGFGFIEPIAGGESVFFHIKDFYSSSSRPQLEQRVYYQLGNSARGKVRALQVTPVSSTLHEHSRSRAAPPRKTPRKRVGTLAIAAIPSFLLIAAAIHSVWKVPIEVAFVYIIASLITFFFYWIDKSSAGTKSSRVSEQTLIFLGLLCGWPGAIVAQQLFRHKTIKRSFQIMFWLSVAFNIGVFVFLNSPNASSIRTPFDP